MSTDLSNLSRKLTDVSRKGFYSPYEGIVFPQTVEKDNWFTSPEFISIYGTPLYEGLSEAEKKKLSFYEAVNFYSINIHGEKSLLEGLSRRLYEPKDPAVCEYLHHFLDEENKHMVFFGTFCTRYAGKVYVDRKFSFPREYAPMEEDFLFFTKVFIFEEIVDYYNLKMSQDAQLHPVAQQINLFHHRDELRHLAFGRTLIAEMFQTYSPSWGEDAVQKIREYLAHYIEATWREYYNPDVYKDLGLSDPYEIAQTAFQSDGARAHRKNVSKNMIAHLLKSGILTEAPRL